MFLGGGGARPGGKLCWLAPPLFCCCCWIWLGVSRKWNCRKNWKQENRKLFIELFSAQKLSSKATDDHMIRHFCFICSRQMHQSIPAVPRPPLPLATAGHLPALWVQGVGHFQILRCPGARHLPTQGQPRAFDTPTVSYQNITTQKILLEKQADWLICQGWEKIEEVCKGMFLILCMHFFIAYQARIAKLRSYQCESMFSGYWIKFPLILFEEHPFIKLFIAVITLQCTINFNVNNFITILKP